MNLNMGLKTRMPEIPTGELTVFGNFLGVLGEIQISS